MSDASLRAVPLLDIGDGGGPALFDAAEAGARRLLDSGRRLYGRLPLRVADRVSRAWLARNRTPYAAEIDRIARGLGTPGAHALNLSFEWGCTSAAHPDPGGGHARLMRVLDWPFDGLGREVVAARRVGAGGDWIDLTWPGAVGVINALAPGRFAAAINQAPMPRHGLPLAGDWLVNRAKVWRSTALPPPHLLRRVFEEAPDYVTAKRLLAETEICIPTIFTLAGIDPAEACVIERTEAAAVVIEGPAAIANKWVAMGRGGRPRAVDNDARRVMLAERAAATWDGFDWLAPPLLNARTRLALVAEPRVGRLIAQGWESDGPATAVLRLG